MQIKVGNIIELKRDNLEGMGCKGEKGVVLYKLYNPVDGWDYMIRLYSGSTEAFLQKDLKLSTKNIDKVNVAW
ncbi:Hypothetical protein DAR_31 [Enterococcus phage dArtagnan]|uniref:Uncharacterized protein n=2 Tax=Aramisvirus TaxID=3152613 RepID=A0A8D6UB73_9CAUD|nr:Hypothetical protein ARAMI_33 [Enterococcus phage Aramis]CAD7767775.1 Hypothetical protein DAR_31 [Enterococcus phage dArtagnan]